VYGLILSFAAVGQAAPDQKSILLTQGIAHAMANTFFGLGIAVQCVFFHMMLSIVTKNLLDSVDLSAVKIENILTRRRIAAGGRETGQPRAGLIGRARSTHLQASPTPTSRHEPPEETSPRRRGRGER
jgi:biopolymer transport protein ExbB